MGQVAIGWFTMDGGGVLIASGGPYALGATMGQPDAHSTLTGGSFSLKGGFWLGGSGVVGVGDVGQPVDDVPLVSRLHPIAPNPLLHHAVVRFDLSRAGSVRLAIFDAAGRVVRTLAEGPFPAGRFDRAWDGRDEGGRRTPAGVYFLHFDAGTTRARQKVVVLGQP
jgi:hypothetical protein